MQGRDYINQYIVHYVDCYTNYRTFYLEETWPIASCYPLGRLETTKTLSAFGVPTDVGSRSSEYKPEALLPNTAT
jgi:hypothetical protein